MQDEFESKTSSLASPVVVGEDLSRLSVDELTRRIERLTEEISRTERERDARGGVRAAADALFRK
ncbi:DUF1192 domain-containing protein [Stappia sp. 28M-7]|jgi:uncharacterized small protein (DUF1192 family)|uniref:DUF1192 domain-containing protein n=1 Tax=Stappia sp. 28M-7 TaxID=2762596 RepID=UPI00163CD597|nr:DUF1192 domain-containing protein [Stappia sp. 28M-7]MBC2861093.1 DUF1192 domain-containing protein [Stappia sp. 28M-7]